MTLQQIAERAGVSAPTISKVLNGRPDVAPATRERVLQALHEQQYLPRGASALPFAHRHIELVFDALRNTNNLEILREIIKSAAEHGGHVRSERATGCEAGCEPHAQAKATTSEAGMIERTPGGYVSAPAHGRGSRWQAVRGAA